MSGVGRAPSDALRLALVGCGEVTRDKHLPALRHVPGIRIVAVADPDDGRRESLARAHRIPRSAPSIDAVLALDGVDAVGVCVPPEAHAEVAIAALQAGKHVWIDKPLTLDLAAADRLRLAAARSGARVMVGFHMRWHRLLAQARSLVQSGILGPLESIHCTWSSPRDDDDLPAWRTSRARGGGALVEIGVHHFDLWRYLGGAEVEEVFTLSRDGRRDDEHAIVAGRLATGVLVSATLSERAPHRIAVDVAGRHGRVCVDARRFDGLDLSTHRDPTGPRTRVVRAARFLRALPQGLRLLRRLGGDYHDSYRIAWAHFESAVRTGTPVGATLEDGIRAVEIVLAAQASRTRHTPVRVGTEPPRAGAARPHPPAAPDTPS